MKINNRSDLTFDNLLWENEFSEQQTALEMQRSVIGNAVVHAQALSYGIPLVFTGDWATRAQIVALRELEAVPGNRLTLTLADERVLYAVFDSRSGTGIEAVPIKKFTTAEAEEFYEITLRFLSVPAPEAVP